jgi:hypothetical protein
MGEEEDEEEDVVVVRGWVSRSCGTSAALHHARRAPAQPPACSAQQRETDLLQRGGAVYITCIALLNSSVFCSLSLLLTLWVTAAAS